MLDPSSLREKQSMKTTKTAKTLYVCQSCSASFLSWAGQCANCGEWNTLVETTQLKSTEGRVAAAPIDVINLAKIKASSSERKSCGLVEFDRVLGGGFVPGQVVLLAGEPGIGKSTLVTQVCKNMPSSNILYVCGEENPTQIKLRADRMGYKGDNFFAIQETEVEALEQLIYSNSENGQETKFDFLIIDSIQTLHTQGLLSATGSIAQIRESSQKLARLAKAASISVILIGHVTKDGEIAGPKVLEHIVDTILYMEGDTGHMYRVLRTTKNRFGAISEVGMFEMVEDGVREVTNPSELFITKEGSDKIGSCIAVAMEGFRPILYEVQALTTKTVFGYPKRTASGFNVNRLQVLLAVLEKRCNLPCYQYDVYVNIAGGFKVSDSASDLAVCLAVTSSVLNKPLKRDVALFGEVGLLGEIRKVPHAAKRAKEAKRLGYKTDETCTSVPECIKKFL